MTKPFSRPTPDGCGCHWSYGDLVHVDWYTAWGKFADDAEALSRAAAEPECSQEQLRVWLQSKIAEAEPDARASDSYAQGLRDAFRDVLDKLGAGSES